MSNRIAFGADKLVGDAVVRGNGTSKVDVVSKLFVGCTRVAHSFLTFYTPNESGRLARGAVVEIGIGPTERALGRLIGGQKGDVTLSADLLALLEFLLALGHDENKPQTLTFLLFQGSKTIGVQ